MENSEKSSGCIRKSYVYTNWFLLFDIQYFVIQDFEIQENDTRDFEPSGFWHKNF